MTNQELKVTTIAKVNDVAIQVEHDAIERWVPIRPICEALGVSVQGQLEKIKEHPILSSTIKVSLTVAADEKDRNMQCIPIRYVFGWLFTIHPNNVKEEAREALIRYQHECYDALFRYFSEKSDFLQDKQKKIDEKATEFQIVQNEYKTTKNKLADVKKEFDKAREYTFEEWKADKMQQEIPFPKADV